MCLTPACSTTRAPSALLFLPYRTLEGRETHLDESFDLVEDHRLVAELDEGLGESERERAETRSKACTVGVETVSSLGIEGCGVKAGRASDENERLEGSGRGGRRRHGCWWWLG